MGFVLYVRETSLETSLCSAGEMSTFQTCFPFSFFFFKKNGEKKTGHTNIYSGRATLRNDAISVRILTKEEGRKRINCRNCRPTKSRFLFSCIRIILCHVNVFMGNYIISNRSIKTLQTYWASPCNLSACLSATEEVECNMQRWRKVDIDRNID